LVFFKNCTGVEEKAANLKEFIQKINTSSDNAGTIITSYKNFRRLCEFKEELKNALAFEISRFYQEPTCTQSREEMYNLGSDIINYAQKRLIVYQNTPTLILGTKNRIKQKPQQYEDNGSFEIYEKNFQNILEKWIEKYKNIQDAEFIYLFNAKASKEELNACVPSEQKEKKLQEIQNNLRKYKQIEEETKYRFKITPLDKPVSGPFVIGDNRYGIWIMGRDDAFFFSQENEKFSSALTREVKASCQTVKTCDEIMNSLQF
ncbi:MAG: hypothetical protein LBC89_04550, partial [Bacteroidales bacterium]|nr:hypothetical protein [Bacteroidales bacterium]